MPGILHARAAHDIFSYAQATPAAGLTPFVEHYWIVRWDLTGRDPYTQWVLPYPCVNITFTPGRNRVAGVPRGRFSEVLTGAGRVFGVRFRAGGFRPFRTRPVSEITGRFVPFETMYDSAVAEAILAADDAAAVTIMDRFLSSFEPRRDADAALVAAVVDRAAADPAIARVEQLAAEFGVGMRRLQRLFAEHVGVGPKWVVRRYRLHEAAARAATGAGLNLVELAADLGYSDQAHLTRDFSALIGDPPARYANAQ